jgi:hypothetical protein
MNKVVKPQRVHIKIYTHCEPIGMMRHFHSTYLTVLSRYNTTVISHCWRWGRVLHGRSKCPWDGWWRSGRWGKEWLSICGYRLPHFQSFARQYHNRCHNVLRVVGAEPLLCSQLWSASPKPEGSWDLGNARLCTCRNTSISQNAVVVCVMHILPPATLSPFILLSIGQSRVLLSQKDLFIYCN